MEPESVFLALIALLLLSWSGWWLLRRTLSRRRRRRAVLLASAKREPNAAKRRQLMMEWNDLGGMKHAQQRVRRGAVRELGQQARTKGLPLSANPFRRALWGPGRQWKKGWISVDQQIRWIESKRASEG